MNDNAGSRKWAKPLLRYFPLVILTMALGVFAARLYLRYATPMYESTAKIKLADSRDGVPNGNLFKDFDVFSNSNKISAEVELLKSKVLIDRAAISLNLGTTIYRIGKVRKQELYNNSPILVSAEIPARSKWMDRTFKLSIKYNKDVQLITPDGKALKGFIGLPIQTKEGSVTISQNADYTDDKDVVQLNDRYEFMLNSRNGIVNKIVANLDVMSVDKDVPVLRISYRSAVPDKSADIVNGVAQAYINDYVAEKFRSADTTVHFINNELQDYTARLSGSESSIEGYRDAHNIINIRQETETDLRKIADLKKQQASVRMNIQAIDSLNKYMSAGQNHVLDLAPNFEAFTDLLSTELIKKIKQLQAEKKDLLTRYTPENEKVMVIDDKIADITSYLRESIHNTQINLRLKYQDLSQTIASAEAEFIGLPTKEKNMTILERDFGMNEQIYRFLREKRTEAEIARAATISFHRIISPAETPTSAIFPNGKLIQVFSGFLGLIFGVIFIYGIHHFRGGIESTDDIYRETDTPITTIIPFIKTPAEREKLFSKWILEMELQGQLPSGTVLTVSSMQRHEGKEFVAAGLVQAAMQLGKKVLFVSLDEKQQVFSEHFQYQTIHDFPDKWYQIAEWQSMLWRWQQHYDLIVIRNKPVNDATSAMMVMAASDLNLMVLDSVKSKKATIREADQLREKLKLTNMSFVLNRANYKPTIFKKARQIFSTIIRKDAESKAA